MEDGAFQWDDAKAAENYAKHGVTFETARAVFKDPFALDWRDERRAYGEDRYVAIGISRRTPRLCRLHNALRRHPDYFGQRGRAL
ncbi:MAG TPA: BrnT family toxin [Roseiarcus sp.]|nr:BrnT family toxin [Roseiarcus sp.]